ncbi:Hint domain-containing protein [Ancylobacter oerskovii]|uniref:Hint domain-containing protein n=1 Tax=Ancylobacter oerskovii TaxID=459519 RepID=A0ABW4Z4N4_9HYPH|nr:Hint domain-containing protein [Ancylobacter oerskovii]MBS7545778.1 Hint domain-containing protein [Ancylobacter oerskovii]
MATATYSYLYQAGGAGGTVPGDGLPQLGSNVTVTEGTDDGVFSVSETLVIEPAPAGMIPPVTYLGTIDGGIAVQDGNGSYYWVTNRTYEPSDETPFSAVDSPACFLAGTLIATPEGAVPVERLKAGDLVRTVGGAARPVRWLGRQTVSTRFTDPLRVLPVRIEAGALGEGVPARDLHLSADHALWLDGLLVQAGALVNDVTITRRADVPESFVYYHVELDDHALILAEGVPAESFVDNVSRRRFDNWQEAPAREPNGAMREIDLPRVKSSRQLPPALARRLAERARLRAGIPTQVA